MPAFAFGGLAPPSLARLLPWRWLQACTSADLARSRPISPGLAQACISSATVGSPERLKASGIAPSSRINQLLFNLIRSAGFVPDSVADKARPAYLFPDVFPPLHRSRTSRHPLASCPPPLLHTITHALEGRALCRPFAALSVLSPSQVQLITRVETMRAWLSSRRWYDNCRLPCLTPRPISPPRASQGPGRPCPPHERRLSSRQRW